MRTAEFKFVRSYAAALCVLLLGVSYGMAAAAPRAAADETSKGTGTPLSPPPREPLLNQTEMPTLWQQERKLLRAVEEAQKDHGTFSGRLIPSLQELANFYITGSRCESAVPVLLEALKVSRATEGLFNQQQMTLLDPLLECYVALDLQDEFERELRYSLLLAEQTYGRNDPRLLPALDRTGRWYEQVGRYISARLTYDRAVSLARKAGGKRDMRMVEPLRGIARAYRLEYVHGLDPTDAKLYPRNIWRSKAILNAPYVKLDVAGQNALKQALKILRSHADANRDQLVETLLDLGDWNHMADSWRFALSLYQEAWQESAADDYTGKPLFVEPEPIFYRTESATLLRQLPYQREHYEHYWIDFSFTVTRFGLIKDLVVADSNAPKDSQRDRAWDFKQARYRPRFESGTPIDVPGCHLRQGIYSKRQNM